MLYTGNRIGGSNPPLSASSMKAAFPPTERGLFVGSIVGGDEFTALHTDAVRSRMTKVV